MSEDDEPPPLVPAEPTAESAPTTGPPISIAQSSANLAVGTLVSRITGFLRAALLTALLGVQGAAAYDAFSVANTVPNQIFVLIAGGFLNAVIVPQIVRAARNPDGGAAFLNALLTLTLLTVGLVTALAVAAAPLVPTVMATFPGGSATSTLCVAFAFWCLPQIFGYASYALFGQVLSARGQFGAYTWAPILNNVIAIGGILILFAWIGPFSSDHHDPPTWTAGQIAVLGGSATLGVTVQALALLRPLRKAGIRYRPHWGFRALGLRSVGRVALWALATVLVSQIGIVSISRASTGATDDGGAGRGAYDNALLLFTLPHALVTVSVVTVLFTSISRAADGGDPVGVRSITSAGLRLTGVFTVFAAGAGIVLAPSITNVLFFLNSPADATAIAHAAMAMLLGLIPFSAQHLLQRVFYAFEDARTPFLIQIPVVTVTSFGALASGWFLSPEFVVVGIGVSMSVSYLTGALISGIVLRRRLHARGRRVIRTYRLLMIAAAVSGGAGYGVQRALQAGLGHALLPDLATLVVSGSAMLAVYVLAARVLGIGEMDEMKALLTRQLHLGPRTR
jgi:putative peptidoglycan lipid II flippase